MAIEGLAGILKYKADQKAKEEARNRPKAEYLSSIFPETPKNKSGFGDEIVVQFVQELDKNCKNYDPEKGIGLLLKEHEPPGRDGFKRRANCTDPEAEDKNDCYACLRKEAEYVKDAKEGNWKTKTNLYINVAVIVDGKPKVFVLSRNADSAFMDDVLYEINERGTLLDTAFRIKKSGSGTSTQWGLRPVKDEMFDISELEAFDLKETVERAIPLEDQPKYYGAVWSGRGNASDGDSESKATQVDDDNDAW
jgi:hypothetical protein